MVGTEEKKELLPSLRIASVQLFLHTGGYPGITVRCAGV